MEVECAAVVGVELPKSKVIDTKIMKKLGTTESEIRLVLLERELSDVFTAFCRDVAHRTVATANDSEAVVSLIGRFIHWRNLLAPGRRGGLSESEAQGLFGELTFLSTCVIPKFGDIAIQYWRGPDQEDRDFLIERNGYEVKTTTMDEPALAKISSERQLSNTGLDKMYLIVYKLEALNGGVGTTLNQIVDVTRGLLRPQGIVEFNERLVSAGYLDIHAEEYERMCYTIREEVAFHVRDQFPRITEDVLPVGVGLVKYSLDLSACEPWIVPAVTLLN